MISAVQHAVLTFFCDLVGDIYTTVTKYATRHVELDIRSEVYLIECSPRKFISSFFPAVFIAEILQVALSGLIANRTVERMVKEQKFHYSLACLEHLFTCNVLYHHAVHHVGPAARHQLGHWPRIGR